MDESYFICRMRASLDMARKAAGSAARLIHFELAGRYSVAAIAAASGSPSICPKTSGRRVSSFHSGDLAPTVSDAGPCRFDERYGRSLENSPSLEVASTFA